jgi:hypothetical protein
MQFAMISDKKVSKSVAGQTLLHFEQPIRRSSCCLALRRLAGTTRQPFMI